MEKYFGTPIMVDDRPLEGMCILVPPNDKYITPAVMRGDFEREVVEIFLKYIEPDMICCDIGACFGIHTLLLARLAYDGLVYAFEPEPYNFSLLKQNVEINGLSNVIIENIAITDKHGRAILYLTDDNAGGHSLFKHGSPLKVEVDTVSIDEYLRGKAIDFMKIDVEGAEYLVLKGARRTLKASDHLMVVMELRPEPAADVLTFMEERDFEVRLINDERITYDELMDIFKEMDEGMFINLLFVR